MRKAMLLGSALILFSHPVFTQITLSPQKRPFLTVEQLTAVVESESAAGDIVSKALAYRFRVSPHKTTTVLGAQIPEHWLPIIPDVRFVRLSDDAARAHDQQCGRLLFIGSLTRMASDVVEISVEEGTWCDSGGTVLRFNRTAVGWRLEENRIHGGFAGGVSGCTCR